jgi:hypothetical protein
LPGPDLAADLAADLAESLALILIQDHEMEEQSK